MRLVGLDFLCVSMKNVDLNNENQLKTIDFCIRQWFFGHFWPFLVIFGHFWLTFD